MAHPHLNEARASHSEKLHKMTTHYGSAAGPSENIPAPTNRLKQEGGEKAIGFGADASPTKARGDRFSRARGIPNRKHGGKVKHRAAGGTADSPIEEANINQSLAKSGVQNRAHGGRAGKKGATHVNVIVAPQSGNTPIPAAGIRPVPPVGLAAPPAAPPMPPPAMARPPMPMPPPMAPGAMPPGMMPPRASGGRVHKDEAQDRKLIHDELKAQGLTRSDKPVKGRASGGRMHHMTAGAVSGEGRLEKIGKKAKDAGAPQTV